MSVFVHTYNPKLFLTNQYYLQNEFNSNKYNAIIELHLIINDDVNCNQMHSCHYKMLINLLKKISAPYHTQLL